MYMYRERERVSLGEESARASLSLSRPRAFLSHFGKSASDSSAWDSSDSDSEMLILPPRSSLLWCGVSFGREDAEPSRPPDRGPIARGGGGVEDVRRDREQGLEQHELQRRHRALLPAATHTRRRPPAVRRPNRPRRQTTDDTRKREKKTVGGKPHVF